MPNRFAPGCSCCGCIYKADCAAQSGLEDFAYVGNNFLGEPPIFSNFNYQYRIEAFDPGFGVRSQVVKLPAFLFWESGCVWKRYRGPTNYEFTNSDIYQVVSVFPNDGTGSHSSPITGTGTGTDGIVGEPVWLLKVEGRWAPTVTLTVNYTMVFGCYTSLSNNGAANSFFFLYGTGADFVDGLTPLRSPVTVSFHCVRGRFCEHLPPQVFVTVESSCAELDGVVLPCGLEARPTGVTSVEGSVTYHTFEFLYTGGTRVNTTGTGGYAYVLVVVVTQPSEFPTGTGTGSGAELLKAAYNVATRSSEIVTYEGSFFDSTSSNQFLADTNSADWGCDPLISAPDRDDFLEFNGSITANNFGEPLVYCMTAGELIRSHVSE